MKYAKFDQERASRLIRIIRDDLGQSQAKARQDLKNELSKNKIQGTGQLKELYESQIKEISLEFLNAYLNSVEKNKYINDEIIKTINQHLKSFIENQSAALHNNLQEELTRIGSPKPTIEATKSGMELIKNRTIRYIRDVLNEKVQNINESIEGQIIRKDKMKNTNNEDNWEKIEKDFDESKKSFGKKINFIKDKYIRTVIFRDIEHAYNLCKKGYFKPSVLIAGGVIEELLRQYLLYNNKKPNRDTFDEYIKTCEQYGLLKSAIRQLSDSVRQFRNLVHIAKEKSSKHKISKATAWGAVSIIFTISNDF